MKKLLLLFLLPLFTLFAEEPLHTGEGIISLKNYSSSWNVTFVATAVTERWDENYYLTSDYETATVSLIGQQTVPPHVPTAYFDLVNDPIAGLNPIMALGKYKISAIEGGVEQAYFYMDWRTSDYGASPDVYFKYDIANNHFRNAEDTQTIDGTTQTVWDLVSGIDHVTTGLELYLNASSQSGHPYLQWNQYHSTVSGYYVHKKLTTESGTMTYQYYTTSTSWTDNDFTIGNPRFTNDEVEYWITAKFSPTQQSLEGNHIVNYGTSWIQWKISSQDAENELSYNLKQNYPNPFNPSTKISYQLKEDGFVNLKVYNSIGETVTELVNQRQEQGNYSIEFNASNLPSGIYLYKIQTNNFTDVKKMILLR